MVSNITDETEPEECDAGKNEVGDKYAWDKNKNKIFRMKGLEYKGLKENKNGYYKCTENKTARKLGPWFNLTFCIKYANKRQCNSITDEDKLYILLVGME